MKHTNHHQYVVYVHVVIGFIWLVYYEELIMMMMILYGQVIPVIEYHAKNYIFSQKFNIVSWFFFLLHFNQERVVLPWISYNFKMVYV